MQRSTYATNYLFTVTIIKEDICVTYFIGLLSFLTATHVNSLPHQTLCEDGASSLCSNLPIDLKGMKIKGACKIQDFFTNSDFNFMAPMASGCV
jgi:hypothetical protein